MLAVITRRMEQKQIGWYSRFRYVVSAIVFIDLPLWFEIRRRDWVLAGVCLFLMLAITYRRIGEIGWDKRWVVPYCCLTLTPLALLYIWPSWNPWLAFSLVAALHFPVMAWPASTREALQIESTHSFATSTGLGRDLIRWVIFTVIVSAIVLWMAPDSPGYARRELAFVVGGVIALWLAVGSKPARK
jgi:hypothetical protein